jgi:hypothetical protein
MPVVDLTHAKQVFTDNVRDLAGSPMRSMLKEFVDHDSQKGSVVYLDSAGAGDDVVIEDLKTDKKSRKTYEADATKTLEKFNAIFTPHNEISRQRTLSQPKLLRRGHSFDEDEDILELVDPKNKVIRQLFRAIVKGEDQLILNGIKASSVVRVDGDTSEITTETVSFPASQQFTTANAGYIHLKDISTICQKFEDQYVTEPIFCLISPTDKKGIIDNNDKVHDTDFVNSHSYFHDGKLPDIYGVHFIPHPLVSAGSFYAFTKEAIVMNTYSAFKSSLTQEGLQNMSYVAYLREKLDCKRVDDLQVVHGTVQ